MTVSQCRSNCARVEGRYHDAALWEWRRMQRLGCSTGIIHTQIRRMTAMRRTSFDSFGLLPYGSRETGSGCRGLHFRPDGSNDSRQLPKHGREWCAGVLAPCCRCLGRDEREPLPSRKASIVQLSMVRGLPWQPRLSLSLVSSRRFIAIPILRPPAHRRQFREIPAQVCTQRPFAAGVEDRCPR
jgi:hypothetical protein